MSGITSDLLNHSKEEIMSLWEQRAIREIPSAGKVATLLLRNSISIYLEHLAKLLSTSQKMDGNAVFDHNAEAMRIAKLHGSERAGIVHYILGEVISEYHILREVIFQVLEADIQLSKDERDIILDSIEQNVNDAAVKFTEIHSDIQQKFINTLTHDLKNPLSIAKMSAELILQLPNLSDTGINFAGRIIVSVNRLDAMIRDLLDASRIRAGEELTLQFIQCDLNALIHEVIDQMTLLHGNRFVLHSETQVTGYWGRDGLRRAIENLIGNAVKYSTPETPIMISLKRMDACVQFIVHNEGEAIPEKEQPFLFRQFQRAKSAINSKTSGWGLGLTLVKGIVDAHKGTVRVESMTGQGTSFIVTIPFSRLRPWKQVEQRSSLSQEIPLWDARPAKMDSNDMMPGG